MIAISNLPSVTARDLATHAIRITHYAFPLLLFFWFVLAQTVSVCTLANLKTQAKKKRRVSFLWLQLLVIASYVGEAFLMIARALIEKGWWSSQDNVIYILSSILVWGVIEITLLDTEKPVWYPYYGSCAITFFVEICLLALSAKHDKISNGFHSARLIVECLRVLVLLLCPFVVIATLKWEKTENSDEESGRLLGENVHNGYGSTETQDSEDSVEAREAKAKMLKKLEESGNWWTYAKSFAIFWPLLWPKKEKRLQLSMVLVGVCLLVERGLNVLVPRQLGIVTNSLSDNNGAIPWFEVFLYVLFRWLASGSGVSALQSYLWLPVEQYSYRSITSAAYNHVMSLSYDFHSSKNTGELFQSVYQGRSVNGFIESVLFQVLPMLTDLCVAFGYFLALFNAYMALTVGVVSVTYLWVTAKMGSMRNQMRRDYNKAFREEGKMMYETMSSWTTVSYFNRVPYEQDRYSKVIKNFQQAERNWIVGLSILNVAQSMIFTIGLLAASFLAVYQVSRGEKPVGSFVTLLSYWAQLSGPLAFFANFFRKIQNQMLDAERLLELLQTKPTIVDKPDAKYLDHIEGEIVFDKVNFAYDPRKSAITDLSLRIPPGATVALVGETGGGKSTCFKLLFRFYDVGSGSIKIDGIDIRDIALLSLRANIGVVPQDSQMFNDTIMNNIKYANFEVSDERVYEACRAASIHDKIMSFPDGYNSTVGERGVRLSGGELQRVAIARAIIKDSKIILLDEATSSVDTIHEAKIQGALNSLAKRRTMFIVAHRLSTIMNADIIAVIKGGKLLETGNHETLLEKRGEYYQLWTKQLKNDGSETDKNIVNDLSPKSRGEQLRMALTKTGARFHSNKPLEEGTKSVETVPTISMSCPQERVTPKRSPQITATSAPHTQSSMSPTVTFSLGGTPQTPAMLAYRPFLNTRVLTPVQGILKTSPKHLNSNQRSHSHIDRQSFSLKPDAKEFVPQSYLPRPHTSPGRSQNQYNSSYRINSHLTLPSLQGGRNLISTPGPTALAKLPSPVTGTQEDTNNRAREGLEVGTEEVQELQQKLDDTLTMSGGIINGEVPKKDFTNGEASQTTVTPQIAPSTLKQSENLDSKAEEPGDEDVKTSGSQQEAETENGVGVKKKRRRSRRRSHKSKPSDEMDQILVQRNGENSSQVLTPTNTASCPIEADGNHAMYEEDPNTAKENTAEKRLKRRVRNISKSKPKLENEEPATMVASADEKRGESNGKLQNKSFESSSSGSSHKDSDTLKTSAVSLRTNNQFSLGKQRPSKPNNSLRGDSRKVENVVKTGPDSVTSDG